MAPKSRRVCAKIPGVCSVPAGTGDCGTGRVCGDTGKNPFKGKEDFFHFRGRLKPDNGQGVFHVY